GTAGDVGDARNVRTSEGVGNIGSTESAGSTKTPENRIRNEGSYIQNETETGVEREHYSAVEQSYNMACWYNPALLLHELEEVNQTPELKNWSEGVRTSVKELSHTFPGIDKSITEKKASKTATRRIGNGKLIRAITQRDENLIPLTEWDFQNTEISTQRRELLTQLTQKVHEAREIQRYLTDKTTVAALIRANYTLQRRLILWYYCDRILQSPMPKFPSVSERQWDSVIAQVEELVEAHPYHDTWRSYLRLNVLLRFSELSPSVQREIAWQLMNRLQTEELAASQQQFLAQEAFRQLNHLLATYAAVRLAEDYLMYSAENYEMGNDIKAGNHLVQESRRLELEQRRPLTPEQKTLEKIYRNANLRLFVSRDFLNSSLPQPGAEERTIQENVLNRPVYGRGVSNTTVSIRMVPDEKQFRLGFLVEGSMQSSTYSPDVVTVYNNSDAQYVAFKEILLSDKGLHMKPAVAEVENQIHLRDLQTPFDPIPVLGFVANGVARNQAESKQHTVRQMTEYKIRNEVCTNLDNQVNEKLNTVNDLLQNKVFTPLNRLELDLEQVDAQTTQNDAVIRMRLAGNSHPGAFTPRPVPPADSMINFQAHESTLNNFLQQFHLEGRTFTVDTLLEHIHTRLPNLKLGENRPEPEEELFITFAEKNAVTVHIHDSMILVRVAVQELRVGKRQWKNFEVEAPYLIQSGPKAIFAQRDGPVRLIGRIPVGQQVAVRGIFSKIFQKTEEKNILPEKFLANPRFADLTVNQLVLHDGWLSVSFSPAGNPSYAQR
ncbi:MAG: hypothetical protein Q4C70_13975, partial [Planctomycetia bacterium]|nr:hypothetical protein [Planctomycetia bacterium]